MQSTKCGFGLQKNLKYAASGEIGRLGARPGGRLRGFAFPLNLCIPEIRERCSIVFIPSLCQLPFNTQMGFKGSFVLHARRAAVFALSVNNAESSIRWRLGTRRSWRYGGEPRSP